MRIFLPAAGIFLALGVILGLGLFFGSIPEVQVEEALKMQVLAQIAHAGERVPVQDGLEIPESEVQEALAGKAPSGDVKIHGVLHKVYLATGPLDFEMRDKANPDQLLRVKIMSDPPDTFELDRDVSVIAHYVPETGMWEGDKIYTKCPSKYEDGGEDVPYSEQGLPAVQAEGQPGEEQPGEEQSTGVTEPAPRRY